MSDKQLVLDTVQNIDDTTSYEEILYTLYTQLEVQKGIKDMEEENTKTSKEVKEIIDKWYCDFICITYKTRFRKSIKKIKKRYTIIDKLEIIIG